MYITDFAIAYMIMIQYCELEFYFYNTYRAMSIPIRYYIHNYLAIARV